MYKERYGEARIALCAFCPVIFFEGIFHKAGRYKTNTVQNQDGLLFCIGIWHWNSPMDTGYA